MPFDIGIDSDGEIDFDDDGNARTVEGPAMVAQKIALRLDTQKGAWWADLDLGVRWIEGESPQAPAVFGRPFRRQRARALVLAEILAVEEVTGVRDLRLAVDFDARAMTGTFTALTTLGAVPVAF